MKKKNLNEELLEHSCAVYLCQLCVEIPDRSVGSEGNRAATRFFEETISALGWSVECQEFEALDWIDGGASLACADDSFQVFVSPYSLGCDVSGQLICISNVDELERSDLSDKLLLLYGDIAKEQLMPKNFVFYNPEEHQRIISLLENGHPKAIICATGRNASLAGGAYPFPLIEDGDFNLPSVYMTEEEGLRLLSLAGRTLTLSSASRRVPGTGYNIIARKGSESGRRIVITAHIDAKKGTPGALDNASGVVALLLLAQILKDYLGSRLIEIVAFNGEDYYAVPGQMRYLASMQNRFDEILLNINIDGAGYKGAKTAFSFYNLPSHLEADIRTAIGHFAGIIVGTPWVQGDHSMFIQQGCPAAAVTSDWFSTNIDTQQITHTSKDNIDLIDCQKLVEIAQALDIFIRNE